MKKFITVYRYEHYPLWVRLLNKIGLYPKAQLEKVFDKEWSEAEEKYRLGGGNTFHHGALFKVLRITNLLGFERFHTEEKYIA